MAGARERRLHPAFIFALIFTAVFVAHGTVLRLPYFWDEAGYFIPAARDLLLTGDPIPTSTLSNAHPPLVMAWLAMWWKLSGYTPAVTRTAMLLFSAFALLGTFRLSRAVSGLAVAASATLCTALYPVFFAQSSLAHLDMAAAAFTVWGLYEYVRGRQVAAVLFFALAGLSKETAVLAPIALLIWEITGRITRSQSAEKLWLFPRRSAALTATLLLPLLPLAAWFAWHHHRTGHFFGNPEFFRYNVAATLHPLRIAVALLMRLWHLLGYMNMLVLTVPAALAMMYSPLEDDGRQRPRIAIRVQLAFAAVILVYLLFLAVIGGAELARYLLPVYPLVILLCVSTLWRRVRWWGWIVAAVCALFVLGLLVNPPYRFAPEDNLAYSDYVKLHKIAAGEITHRYPGASVLTAWPASDELSKPYLGYVANPVRVVRIENFSAPQIAVAAQARGQYEVVLAFSTKYEPAHPLLGRLFFWERLQTRFFDYHRDLPPQAIAQLLEGRIVMQENRGGQWIALIQTQHAENARLATRK